MVNVTNERYPLALIGCSTGVQFLLARFYYFPIFLPLVQGNV